MRGLDSLQSPSFQALTGKMSQQQNLESASYDEIQDLVDLQLFQELQATLPRHQTEIVNGPLVEKPRYVESSQQGTEEVSQVQCGGLPLLSGCSLNHPVTTRGSMWSRKRVQNIAFGFY